MCALPHCNHLVFSHLSYIPGCPCSIHLHLLHILCLPPCLVIQSSPTFCDPLDSLLCPWNSPDKNTVGVAVSSPGNLPNPGIKPVFPVPPGLQVDSLSAEPWRSCPYLFIITSPMFCASWSLLILAKLNANAR